MLSVGWLVFAVLVAVLLLPAALATSWVDRTVADREGYLDAVAPLAEEEVVRDAVTARVRVAEDEGRLVLESVDDAVRRAQALVRHYAPSAQDVADELLSERRADAERE